jgi:GT2 family glycosyltransferase
MRKSTFQQIGGYTEDFPYAGFEDAEFSFRVQNKNIPMYIDPNVMMYHNELDRQDMNQWLARKRRGAFTRRIAVDMGYRQFEIKYSFLKEAVLLVIGILKPIIAKGIQVVGASKILDIYTFKLINILLAWNIYKGYNTINNSTYARKF